MRWQSPLQAEGTTSDCPHRQRSRADGRGFRCKRPREEARGPVPGCEGSPRPWSSCPGGGSPEVQVHSGKCAGLSNFLVRMAQSVVMANEVSSLARRDAH